MKALVTRLRIKPRASLKEEEVKGRTHYQVLDHRLTGFRGIPKRPPAGTDT
jgi:hypothetical protein